MVIPHSSSGIINTGIGIGIGIGTSIRIRIRSIRIGRSTRRYLILSSIRKDIILLLRRIVQTDTDSVFDSNTPL